MDKVNIKQFTNRIDDDIESLPEIQGDDFYRSIYHELRVIAHSHRRRWSGNDTLNTTALVHEAYLKMASQESEYKNRKHFFATAAKAMRQVLVNYAERSNAEKRNFQAVDFKSEQQSLQQTTVDELLYIDKLLEKIDKQNSRHCKIIECRVFGGMNIDETAEVIGISVSTVKREWALLSALSLIHI